MINTDNLRMIFCKSGYKFSQAFTGERSGIDQDDIGIDPICVSHFGEIDICKTEVLECLFKWIEKGNVKRDQSYYQDQEE
jgi:hypothetical protein